MSLIRAVSILALVAFPQETVVQIVVSTKDGHRIVGTPTAASLKIENSLGTVDVFFRNIAILRFDGDTVSVATKDGTSLKGKVQLKSLKVASSVGDLDLKLESLKEAKVQLVLPGGPMAQKEDQVLLMIRTRDGNDLVGVTDLVKIPFESTIARFELEIRHLTALTLTVDPHFLSLADGSEIRGTAKLASAVKIQSGVGEFTIKPENIAAIQFRGVRLPARKSPENPPGPARNPPGPAGPAKPPALEPAQKLRLASALGDMRLSKDGTRIYGLNLSEGKLCRWKLPGFEEDGSVQLGGEKTLSFDPSGEVAVAAGRNTISIIAAETLQLRKSFAVDVAVEDVYAIDKEYLLTTGPSGSAIVSIPKTAVVQKIPWGAMNLTVAPKGDRIYAGESIFEIERLGAVTHLAPLLVNSGGGSGSRIVISPDGRFGCTHDARVFRFGRCWQAARAQLGQLDRNSTAAFSADSQRLYLFTDQGFLKVYGMGDLKIEASHYLGIHAFKVILESDGKGFVVAGWAFNDPSGQPRRYSPHGAPVDLYRYVLPQ